MSSNKGDIHFLWNNHVIGVLINIRELEILAKRKRTVKPGPPSPAAVAATPAQKKGVLFAIVALMAIYPLFFRALFFDRAMFVNHIIVAAVFILFWASKWKNKDLSFIRTPLDWAVLAFALAYAFSLITAVHFGDALYGCLKAFNYFMLYWLVGQVVTGHRSLERMAQMLLLGGLGVAVIGVLAASGFHVYPGAYNKGLIYSSLQYHNATAAFLAAMSILSLALLTGEEKRGWQITYSLAACLLQVIVFATLSKGAWLTLALACLVLVLGMPGRMRLKTVYFMLALGAVAFVVGNRFLAAVTGPRPIMGIMWILGGLVLAAAVYFLWEAACYLIKSHPRGRVIVIAGGAFLILGSALLLFNGSLGISRYVIRELLEIGQSDHSSYVTRLDFVRWGISIVKDYPLFGAGAGGWEGLYHRYQDYLFWTTQAHNHFIQVWVEAGTVGLITYLGIWLAMFWSLWSIYRGLKQRPIEAGQNQGRQVWSLVWGCAATVITLGIHASIDFDLSLPALSIVWFTLMAMINAALSWQGKTDGRAFSGWPAAGLSAVMGILVLTMGLAGLASLQSASQGRELLEKARESKSDNIRWNMMEQSARSYRQAAAIYPWEAEYHAELSAVYAEQLAMAQARGDQDAAQYYKNTVQSILRADNLSPGDMDIQNRLLDSAVRTSHLPLIMDRLDAATIANPLDMGKYETRSTLLWMAAEQALRNGDQRTAEYCRSILQIPDMIGQQQARIKAKAVNWQGQKLEVNATIELNMARAHYLLGHYHDASAILATLWQWEQNPEQQNPEAKRSTQAFYAASLQRQGKTVEAQAVLNAQKDERAVVLYNQLLGWQVPQ